MFAIVILLLTLSFAVTDNTSNVPGSATKIKKQIEIVPEPVKTPVDEDKPRDIVLKKFYIEKDQILSNETIEGSFEVKTENLGGVEFRGILELSNSDYIEEFYLNKSGKYKISPIKFDKEGNYTLNLILDKDNNIDEDNESNNNATLNIEVLPLPIDNDNTTLPIDNQTNENLSIITGGSIFDFFKFINNKPKPQSQSFVYLNGRLILAISGPNNDEIYYHEDLQKNIIIATDTNGNVVQSNHFEPFGNGFSTKNDMYNDRRYSEKETDNSNLVYFGARYYDAEIGRFNSNDPVFDTRESGYAYVSNNPLAYNDPDGQAKVSNNKAPDLIVKGPHDAYYNINNVYVSKVNSRNNLIPTSSAGLISGGIAGFSEGVAFLRNVQIATKDAIAIGEDIETIGWNNFWINFIPMANTFAIRDNSPSSWENPFTGIQTQNALRPYKYLVTMSDVEYTMTKINNERDYISLLRYVDFSENANRIYFNNFRKKPLSEEQKALFLQMIKRVHSKKLPDYARSKPKKEVNRQRIPIIAEPDLTRVE